MIDEERIKSEFNNARNTVENMPEKWQMILGAITSPEHEVSRGAMTFAISMLYERNKDLEKQVQELTRSNNALANLIADKLE